MCSPIQCLPSYKEPPPCIPCIPVSGPRCLPCGIDNVTLRRPLIVGDSTFEYRPTSWPGMVLNNQDKKIRYQLINYERPFCAVVRDMLDRNRWKETIHSTCNSDADYDLGSRRQRAHLSMDF